MALERNIEARLRWLDEKFRTGGRFTKECLLREVNAADTVNVRISKRTLEYDLERLRGRVSLLDAYVGNEKVYFYENPRASYFDTGASVNPVLLERFLSFIAQFDGLEGFNEVKNSMLALAEKYHIETGRSVISFETDPEVQGLRHLDKLYAAIRGNQVLEIKSESYNRSAEAKYRSLVVHPYYLKEYANRWYLIGYTKEYGETTCLAVDRMRSIVTKEGIEFRSGKKEIDYSMLFDDRIGVSPGEIIDLRIRVHPVRYRYFCSKKLHFSQTDEGCDAEGWHLLSFHLMDNEELRQKLLSFGPEIEIIGPDILRQKLMGRIKKMAELYWKSR